MEEIKQIEQFCRIHSLEIVSLGAPQMWIKNHLVLTPLEALAAFRNAEFVVTDTFHGTISRPSNYNKMKSLIKDLEIEQHYANDFSSLEEIYQIENDKSRINALSIQGREHTVEYLKRIVAQLQ